VKVSGVLMRSSAIRLVLLVLAGLFVLLTVGLLGFSLRERLRLTDELVTTRQAVAAQEVLYPLYVELKSPLTEWSMDAMAVPGYRLLDEAAVLATPALFKQMSEKHGLELAPVLFRVETEDGKRFLHVELPMRGSYLQFGSLLDEVVRMEALDSLVRIVAVHEGEQDRIRVELKLGLE